MLTHPLDDGHRQLLAVASDLIGDRFALGRHHVAAALRLADGAIVTGVHVGSRRVNVCAEQVALGAALTQGAAAPVACASVIRMTEADEPSATSPCGVCREVLGFYNPAMTVVVVHEGRVVTTTCAELLPAPWLLPAEIDKETRS